LHEIRFALSRFRANSFSQISSSFNPVFQPGGTGVVEIGENILLSALKG
jgi:hypothetical protein